MCSEVDQYIAERIAPEYHSVVALVRDLMRECAPTATELISYDMPMWKLKDPIAWIMPARTHVTFSFRAGTEVEDRYGLLKGRGKTARGVQLKRLEDVNQEALRDYIRQAVQLDKEAADS